MHPREDEAEPGQLQSPWIHVRRADVPRPAGQMQCLHKLWTKESDWKTTATNASSGAYGVVQSLPATKMASAGADYMTNYRTQINWGLNYVKERYASPCGALNFHYAHNWY